MFCFQYVITFWFVLIGGFFFQGTVQNRAFGEMRFKLCPTETFAREQFKKAEVEHYWDQAYSGAIMEVSESEDA